MPHPNEDLIRKLYGAFTGGSYPSLIRDLYDENVVWRIPGSHPLSGDHRGRDAVFGVMQAFEERSEGSIRVELRDIAVTDEFSVAFLGANGTRSGRSYRSREFDIYRIRDGKIIEFWSFSEDQQRTDEFWS